MKKALREAADPLTLVISADIYRSVVRQGHHGIDQYAYQPLVRVQVAGCRHQGWIHIPQQSASCQVADIAGYRHPA